MGGKMFVDDPNAKKYDRNGKYCNKYTNAFHIGIGKELTLEQAKEEWKKDKLKTMMEKRRYRDDYKGYSDDYLKMC